MSEPNLPYTREEEILDLLTQQDEHGWIYCPHCGNQLEPDTHQCNCGWTNPLIKDGII